MVMEVIELQRDQIHIGDRLRNVDPEKAKRLAESIEIVGLDNPVTVGPLMKSGKYRGKHRLAAGATRVAAFDLLDAWPITAKIHEGSALELRLLEVEENLARNELSALDRAVFLAELKDIYEELHPETKHGGDRKTESSRHDGDLKRFTEKALEDFGFSERTVQRDIKLAKSIHPKARKRLSGTHWAKDRKILTGLGKLNEEEQVKAIGYMNDGKDPITARNLAKGLTEKDMEQAAAAKTPPAQKLLNEWARLPLEERNWMLRMISAKGLDEQLDFTIARKEQV